jgi:hypothetical protein
MPPPDRTAVITRIRGLQRLGAGRLTAEALAARRKAVELMRKYGITADELKARPIAPPGAKAPGKPTPVTVEVKIGSFRIRWRP